MDKKIKIMRSVVVGNLIVFGLAACSSSPAPWTQTDDSPWVSKYSAAAESVPSDAVITDTSLNDPLLLADPEPEPIIMQQPDAVPAPEMITPVVVEDLTAEEEIMTMPGYSLCRSGICR